jgi:hypothetical protein
MTPPYFEIKYKYHDNILIHLLNIIYQFGGIVYRGTDDFG